MFSKPIFSFFLHGNFFVILQASFLMRKKFETIFLGFVVSKNNLSGEKSEKVGEKSKKVGEKSKKVGEKSKKVGEKK